MHQSVTETSDPLLDITLTLMASRAGGPSVREIAAAAGVSPSLISYRFGGVEALRKAALGASLQQDARRWEARQRDLLRVPIARSDLAGLLSELLIDEAGPGDTLGALRWLRILRAVRDGTVTHSPFSDAEQEFWASLARQLDLSGGEQRTLTAFFHGLAFGHVIGVGAPGFHAWSSSLVHRFAQRLSGVPVSWPGADSAWRVSAALQGDQVTMGAESAHPTRRAILDAAVRILVEEGTASLTHRRLAIAASASVSSVIHFFESRRAILREAYGLLYRRLCDRALNRLNLGQGEHRLLEPRALAQLLFERDENAERANQYELAGLLNAMFEASQDSETRQLALSLFARSGQTSRSLLLHLPGFEEGAGWLDAQIFRLVSNGLTFLSLKVSPQESEFQPTSISDGLGDALTLLFGERS